MKTRIVIENGIVVDSGTFRECCSTLSDGIYTVAFCKEHKEKSTPQLRYLWGVVYSYIQKAMLDVGSIMTVNEIHEFCLSQFCKETVSIDTGEYIDLRDTRTSQMTTVQLMTYIDLICDFALEWFYIEIPKPKKNELS